LANSKKLIIIRLQGGLGNQMFQYAAVRALTKTRVSFDCSFLNYHNISTEEITARSYEIGFFRSLNLKKINTYFLRFILSKNKKLHFLKFLLPKSLKKIDFITDSNVNHFDVKFSNGVQLFQGDFQDLHLFSNFRDEILEEFKFPELPACVSDLHQAILKNNSVSIHFRRGDYLKAKLNEVHGILDLDYYLKGIREIQSRVKNPVFYIFSDDIDWCKRNLGSVLTNAIYVSDYNIPMWVDMSLMSMCSHNIIANSTFSWWAAWLNINPDKIVISPSKWYSNMHLNNGVKIIPKEWLNI